jgi:signal transduction histidine kinase
MLPKAGEATGDRQVAPDRRVARYLQVAREGLRRVARTVAQLRDLQGVGGEEHSEPADVNQMLSQLLMLNAQRFADQQIEVVWEPDERLPDVPVVADGIRQVFLNILLNAMDAMPAGGTLHIRTARTRRPPGVSIVVSDTGHGMSSSVVARVFEPFYTTKKKGLGLGLFTSRSIMERHGGWIDLQSREGQGTTFELWLPITSQRAAKEIEPGHA